MGAGLLLALQQLLILLKLLLLLLIRRHVISLLTLVGGVERVGEGDRRERRWVSCLAVLLLTSHEVEREAAVGVLIIHFLGVICRVDY